MDRKLGRLIAVAVALAAPKLAIGQVSGNAPFCVASSGPVQCFYHSVQACQVAVKSLGGMCVLNPTMGNPKESSPSTAIPQNRIYERMQDSSRAFSDGYDRGRAIGSERSPYVFACKRPDGGRYVSSRPSHGCTVVDMRMVPK